MMDEYEELELELENEEEDELLSDKYLAVDVAKKRYAINIEFVREIVTLPDVREVPSGKPYERGIIKVRGELIHVIDMRKRLGIASLLEEDEELMRYIKILKKEYEEWVQEIYDSIKENRDFKKALNYKQSSFGKWYYGFKTDDINLSLYLSYFDAPHRAFHNTAIKSKEIQREQGVEAALKFLEKTKETEFQTMMDLFDGLEQPIREAHREVVVIIERDGDLQGISVDSVDKIINIYPESIERKGELKKNELVTGVTDIEGESVIIIDYRKIID